MKALRQYGDCWSREARTTAFGGYFPAGHAFRWSRTSGEFVRVPNTALARLGRWVREYDERWGPLGDDAARYTMIRDFLRQTPEVDVDW